MTLLTWPPGSIYHDLHIAPIMHSLLLGLQLVKSKLLPDRLQIMCYLLSIGFMSISASVPAFVELPHRCKTL